MLALLEAEKGASPSVALVALSVLFGFCLAYVVPALWRAWGKGIGSGQPRAEGSLDTVARRLAASFETSSPAAQLQPEFAKGSCEADVGARRSAEDSLVSLTSCSAGDTSAETSQQSNRSNRSEEEDELRPMLELPSGIPGSEMLRTVADFLQQSDEKWLPELTLVRPDGPAGANSVLKVPSWYSSTSGSPTGLPSRTASLPLLPVFPDSGWEISASAIEMCRKPNGELELLGSGAFGQVYKAIKDGVQPVAVKAFPDGLPLADIAKEVAMLKSCHDRNIVQFIGAVEDEGKTLMVIEYMEGGDLYHALSVASSGNVMWYRRLEDGYTPGKPGLGRRIALDIAKGLHCLHARRVVHLDLKSPNVLLGRDGTAKIADVGLSKLLMDKGYCSNIINMGTLAWSAPEVLMGGRCTEKADIFSYGVILWEIVTGERPTRGGMRPPRVPEECPAAVADLIDRCLSFEPGARPSAKEIVQQLRKCDAELAHPPVGPKVATSRASAERRRQKVQSLPVKAVVALVGLIRGPACGFNDLDARHMVLRGLGVTFPPLYKEYISELAIWLASTKVDDPGSAAHRRIVEVVEALRAAQPQLVVHDCQMMRRLLCGCNMSTFDPRQTESTQDRDNPAEVTQLWQRVLEAIQLTPMQRGQLARAFQQRVSPAFGRLSAQRQAILEELENEQSDAAGMLLPAMVREAVRQLGADPAPEQTPQAPASSPDVGPAEAMGGTGGGQITPFAQEAAGPSSMDGAAAESSRRSSSDSAAAHGESAPDSPTSDADIVRVRGGDDSGLYDAGLNFARASSLISSDASGSSGACQDVFADVTGLLPAEERLAVLTSEWQRLSTSFMDAFYNRVLTPLQEARARLAAWPYTPDPIGIAALIPPPASSNTAGIQSVDTAAMDGASGSPSPMPQSRLSLKGTSLAASMAASAPLPADQNSPQP